MMMLMMLMMMLMRVSLGQSCKGKVRPRVWECAGLPCALLPTFKKPTNTEIICFENATN